MPGPVDSCVGRNSSSQRAGEGEEKGKGRRREWRLQTWQNLDVAMESSSWIFPPWPAIKNFLFSFCQHTVFIFPFRIWRTSRGNSGSLHSLWPRCGQKYSHLTRESWHLQSSSPQGLFQLLSLQKAACVWDELSGFPTHGENDQHISKHCVPVADPSCPSTWLQLQHWALHLFVIRRFVSEHAWQCLCSF